MRKILSIVTILLILLKGAYAQDQKTPKEYSSEIDGTKWITVFDPAKTYNGYNLLLYNRRQPILMDMEGTIVHSWPMVSAIGRARLTKEGNLIVICNDNGIRKYSWEGDILWEFNLPDEEAIPHHDLIQLSNGNYLLLYRKDRLDFILEVDDKGDEVWSWHTKHDLKKYLLPWLINRFFTGKDVTHINSLQEIPPNKWYDSGDIRFKPGNILVSARNLNRIFIIDKTTKDIVWDYSNGLDYQHEASMIEKGLPNEGNILVFNNGYNNLNDYRRSEIVEIDPQKRNVVWKYKSKYFFSSIAGLAQILPNSNIFIASSHGGRIFEITSAGDIVWQCLPPYQPMRPSRYPYDYCQKFKGLPKPMTKEAFNKNKPPFMCRDLFNFICDEPHKKIYKKILDGKENKFLKDGNICVTLLIPPAARLKLAYGVTDLSEKMTKMADFQADFLVQLKTTDPSGTTTILKDKISSKDNEKWFKKTVSLDKYAYKNITLCLSVKKPLFYRFNKNTFVGFLKPVITTDYFGPDDKILSAPASKEEQKIIIQQLKSLGYAN